MNDATHPKRPLAKNGYDWFSQKFKGIEAGDVFCVPLPDGSYGFGRLMNAKDGAIIAEFFRIRRQTPDFDFAIIQSGRLFAPVGVMSDSIAYRNRKRPWKVIHKDSDYYPDDLYDLHFYCGYGPGKWQYFTLYERKPLGPVSDEDIRNWQVVGSLMPQHPGRVEIVIVERLEELGL